jgi:hypothetical protein
VELDCLYTVPACGSVGVAMENSCLLQQAFIPAILGVLFLDFVCCCW